MILTDLLGLSKLSAKWAPKALQENQLVQRAELSMSLLSKIEAIDNDFMEQIVTVVATWIYQYNPESKIQSMQWLRKGSIGPIKFKSERSVQKVKATVFWGSEGIILVDFLEGLKTITGIYYEDVLRKFKAAVIKKGQESCTGASHSIMTMHLRTLQELQGLSDKNFAGKFYHTHSTAMILPRLTFFISQAKRTLQRNTISEYR